MDERGFDSMNVIPQVDVMLVLLTIVLTPSTFIAVGAIKVSLPQAMAEVSQAMKPITVTIDRAGTIFLATEPTTLEALGTVLAATTKETPILSEPTARSRSSALSTSSTASKPWALPP